MNLKGKIIAFDIDGTLARNDANPSEYSMEVLKDLVNKGYDITLVTGRNIISSVKIYRKIGMKIAGVFCNGALVCYPLTDVRIKDITIPLQDLYDVIDDENLMQYVDDMLIEIGEKSYALTGNLWKHADVIGNFKETVPVPPNSIVIAAKSHEVQDKIKEIINSSEHYRYRHWWLVGEFYNVNFTKREGVIDLLNHYGKTKDDLVFFGDGENDIEILEYAGLGIAMANASEDVKKHANLVTDLTNEEDGAVKCLLKLIEEN